MFKNGKKGVRLLAATASVANGFWASLAQGADRGQGAAVPVLVAVAAVWVGYFSLSWLFRGIRG